MACHQNEKLSSLLIRCHLCLKYAFYSPFVEILFLSGKESSVAHFRFKLVSGYCMCYKEQTLKPLTASCVP